MKDFLARLRGSAYRWRTQLLNPNIKIGTGLRLYCKLDAAGAGKIVIGRDCVICGIPGEGHKYVQIHTIDQSAMIVIGDRVHIAGTRVTAKFSITIGDDALVEEAVILDTDFHSILPHRALLDETLVKCRIHIGNRVAIGARSMITRGLTIQDDVVLIPGSIVTKSLPPSCVAGGNPAKILLRREVFGHNMTAAQKLVSAAE